MNKSMLDKYNFVNYMIAKQRKETMKMKQLQ